MSDENPNVDCQAILNHVKLRGRGMKVDSFVIDTSVPICYQKALRVSEIDDHYVVLFTICGKHRGIPVNVFLRTFRPATQFEVFLAEWKYEYEHVGKWGVNKYEVYLESALHELMEKYSDDISHVALDDYFHKAFRQIDVVQEPGIDGVIWNLLQQVRAFWVVFERFKVDES